MRNGAAKHFGLCRGEWGRWHEHERGDNFLMPGLGWMWVLMGLNRAGWPVALH